MRLSDVGLCQGTYLDEAKMTVSSKMPDSGFRFQHVCPRCHRAAWFRYQRADKSLCGRCSIAVERIASNRKESLFYDP